jgi:L-seryl-tRNA(Ser) seleniumtransferase
MNVNEALRALPAVDALLQTEAGASLTAQYGHSLTVEALRAVLDEVRAQLRAGESVSIEPDNLLDAAANRLARRFQPSLRRVINATGVIIHTNLGRAPLSNAAQAAIAEVATQYNTLEFDLDTGKRGSRLIHAGDLLREITGAEAALVVNNNASALVLLLSALALGHEVIISRGQLVEIGGGFRIPEVMTQSGATLVEVGTTNRTHAADFERAITPETALLMRAHASNFKIIGFTEMPSLAELAELAHRHNLYLVDDLGSGALLDTALYGLDHEPTVQESLAAGVDLVSFSGDKLLGGPQAGILVGKRDLIDQLRRHPLARAIRADKLALAALTATLDHYRKGEALDQIPVWRMIARPLEEIRAVAQNWASHVGGTVIDGESTVGGGSLPGATLPTALLALDVSQPDDFLARLRAADPPVIARIAAGRVLLDPRTVLPGQEPELLNVLVRLYRQDR